MTSITNVCRGGRLLVCRFWSTVSQEVKVEKVSVSAQLKTTSEEGEPTKEKRGWRGERKEG